VERGKNNGSPITIPPDCGNFGVKSLENLYCQSNLSVICKNRPEFEALLHLEGRKPLVKIGGGEDEVLQPDKGALVREKNPPLPLPLVDFSR
jgi:hypothetical protein